MKIVGVVLLIVGLLLLAIAGGIGFLVRPNWEAGACSPVENARKEADKAAKQLAEVKEDPRVIGTSVERGFQGISDDKDRLLKIALKNCDDAKAQGPMVLYTSFGVCICPGLLSANRASG